MRLSPRDPFLVYRYVTHAAAAFLLELYHEAVEWCTKIVAENPTFPGAYRVLAATHGTLGETKKAKAALDKLLDIMPGLTVSLTRQQLPWKRDEDEERFLDGLRKAVLPEE